LEASYPNKQGDKCLLESETISSSSAVKCFTFWYHMYGNSIGTLRIYLTDENRTQTNNVIWQLSGKQSNNQKDWKFGSVPLVPNQQNFKIVIEGVVGSSFDGDIALDDFVFEISPCNIQPAMALPTTTKPTITTTISIAYRKLFLKNPKFTL
jgi:hypothetical protein